jgi:hypothetical protein
LVPPVLALPNSTWTSCEASRRWTAARGDVYGLRRPESPPNWFRQPLIPGLNAR